ncbi:unnamed protein product [Arctogadus glacialis]
MCSCLIISQYSGGDEESVHPSVRLPSMPWIHIPLEKHISVTHWLGAGPSLSSAVQASRPASHPVSQAAGQQARKPAGQPAILLARQPSRQPDKQLARQPAS